ncbi:helix-turn-helix domain-containing protein [Stenotrophomonas sp. ISL-67]|uniref:helix-turn-helix domain-containing protein n=1 Tax=Stenotrophomonas sp. ISL-67 TaxID=2819171 RepID=UPI001BE547C3|nr:helix-turn-helix domain-containing protein [Stenotrophomonas sp. ISL-67]MBT2766854.1 helix-turn-helix domain-containing protein [Stenotrophomonas sp. ISL-67]
MDSLLAAAARALAAGDVLTALGHVALRSDPPALALRGVAMAQLGELERGRELLRLAWRGFGTDEVQARARCVVAEAEVGLALRDLAGSPAPLLAAARALEARADPHNALQAWLILARRWLLLGRRKEAEAALAQLQSKVLTPALAAMAGLTEAALAARALQVPQAAAALEAATAAAQASGITTLQAEVAQARTHLTQPAARRVARNSADRLLDLHSVQHLLASSACVVDGCRRGVWVGGRWRPLARRPLLFALLRALGQAWPGDVEREVLIADVFRTRDGDHTHRARLRVEIGRVRVAVQGLLQVEATTGGYRLVAAPGNEVAVLMPPIEGEPGAVAALLGDGAAWSSSALALALGASQRTVQRALASLESTGQVRATGRGRTQRWLAAPLSGFTTILLLPASLPGD